MLQKFNQNEKFLTVQNFKCRIKNWQEKVKEMLRVGFEPTPFRTRTLIWRLRPTRPSQLLC